MSLLSSLLVGGSGLRAASAGINATSHNVANASTPGFHRRGVAQSVADPLRRGSVWFGQGVNTDAITRSSDPLLAGRLVSQSGLSAGASSAARAMSVVETLVADADRTSVREALDGLFDALTAATSDPADPAMRRQFGYAAQGFAENLASTAQRLHSALTDFDGTLQGTLSGVNETLAEVARLNSALAAAGGSIVAGDLADRRDALIRSLSEQIGVTAHYDAKGQATVLLGGHALVSGGEARTVTLASGSGTTPRIMVSAGSGSLDVTSAVGGELGGTVASAERTLALLDDLDTLAGDFADAFNTQHAAGFDRYGNAGGAVFAYDPADPAATLTFDSALLSDPDLMAFAGAPSALAGDDGNLRALMGLQSAAIVNGATATQFTSDTMAALGADVANAKAVADHQASILADLDELHGALTGVDLDEEATKLVQFQAAYQASAKVVQATDALLGTLMELV